MSRTARALLPLLICASLLPAACVRDDGSATTTSVGPRIGNDDPRGVDTQPDWDAQASELKQRVGPRMPDPLPTDKRAACGEMLDAARAFYVSVEHNVQQKRAREAEFDGTRESDLEACERGSSMAAVACTTVLLGDRDSEFPWLLDQCSRAYPLTEAERAVLAKPAKADKLELTFVGDVIFGRYREDNKFDPIVEGGHSAFGDMAQALRSDVLVGNLETPVIESLPETSPIGAKFRFGAGRDHVKLLAEANFAVMSLANNHYFDLREDGQLSSPKILSEEGIFPIGASRPIGEPMFKVETLEREGWRIGFVAVIGIAFAIQRLTQKPHG